MHVPWSTWTTACAILPVATAFYPYSPPPVGSSKSTPERRDGATHALLNLNLNRNRNAGNAARRGAGAGAGAEARAVALTLPLRRVPLRPRENDYDIVESKEPGGENSVAVDQDGNDIRYMAAVRIGESEEEFRLLLDSAASNTWVMGGGCESEACGRHNTFAGDGGEETDPTPFSITYGTGSVSGHSAHDTLHIGPLSTPLTFGLATNVSSEFSSYPMDGILGLGRSAQASSLAAPQLIEALAAANLIPKRLYGIHLSRAADGAHDGELNLGALNEDLFDGEMDWVPALQNDNGFWEVALGDAGAGDEMAGFKGKDKSAIIDTGTSYMFLPPADAAALHALVPGAEQDGEAFTVPCDTSVQLKLKFGGATFAVQSEDWVGGTTDGGCRSNVFGRKTFGEDQWLLGDVFLKNVYAGFDFEGGRVGFGVQATSSSGGGGGDGKASASAAQGTASGELLGSSTGTVTSPVFTSISASVSASVSTPSTPSDTSPLSTNQLSHSSPDSSPSATGTPTTSVGAFIPADASPTSPPSSQNVAVQSGGAEEGHTGGAGVLRVSMMGLVWGIVGMVVFEMR